MLPVKFDARANKTNSGGVFQPRMSEFEDAKSDVDDDTLIAEYAAGSQAAAREIIRRLAPSVLALARRMLGDEAEAEDVVQEAMMKLWKIAPDWQAGRAKPSTWLYRVTSNLCTDRLRKRKFASSEEAPEVEDDTPGVVETLELRDRANAVNTALSGLPERQRLALHLRYYQHLANKEIATVLETSVEAVESLLGRGKRDLAKQLIKERDKLGLG